MQTPVDALKREWWGQGQSYWLTRFVLLRLLGFVYLAAFLSVALQIVPLIGSHGLTPLRDYLERVTEQTGSRGASFVALPSVFWFGASDTALRVLAWLGVGLSALLLCGYANALTLFVLWLVYGSFVHVGQIWFGYGWDIQLLETGLLACFLCPLLDLRPFPARPPPTPIIWLFRWLCVRIMWGAGLIKLRGDECWSNLTCLDYHYETQPIPGPLSRYFHFAPSWTHRAGVLFNHLVELIAPFFAFGPRRLRHGAGILFVIFQCFLIASGNLSFLNWLTLVPAIACFDDSFWSRLLPRALVARAERARSEARARADAGRPTDSDELVLPSRAPKADWGDRVTALVFGLVALLSVFPVVNLLSDQQAMNRTYNPLAFVNTYGAFGSVGRERYEIIFEGTDDEPEATARWKAYEFKCKPGDPARRPCLITPYHYRLDWQIWFAAMTSPNGAPWAVHLVWKLLQNDGAALSLLAKSPFPSKPPKYVRAVLYRYQFAQLSDPSGATWQRTPAGLWLQPVSRTDPRLIRFLQLHGFSTEE